MTHHEEAAPSGELQSMIKIEAALLELSGEERERVLKWAVDRFRGETRTKSEDPLQKQTDAQANTGYEDLPQFYNVAAPKTDAEKALVVSCWHQFHGAEKNVEALAVNRELKQLGHGVGNITRAFEYLKGQKPQLVMQAQKSGTTKQARKKYRVTNEGKTYVEKMLHKQVE